MSPACLFAAGLFCSAKRRPVISGVAAIARRDPAGPAKSHKTILRLPFGEMPGVGAYGRRSNERGALLSPSDPRCHAERQSTIDIAAAPAFYSSPVMRSGGQRIEGKQQSKDCDAVYLETCAIVARATAPRQKDARQK